MRQVSAAEVSSQWPILEPLDGCRERPIALNKPVCVAGDRVRVNLPLRDATVSRAHAIFVSDERGAYLRDLASLNHVFVNDEPVREAALRHGDVLKIGPYAFRCEGGLPASGDASDGDATAPAAELRTSDGSVHVPLNVRRTTLLGTRDDCDVKMSGKVSPAHAVIFELKDRWYVRDLRSVSGTFVNGRKVGQAELHPGDTIRIGESELVYTTGVEADADGTLAGSLAEGEGSAEQIWPTPGGASGAPLAVEGAGEPVEPEAAPSDDLETIPLIEETELESLAKEFAQETQSESHEEVVSAAGGPSDSSIIPLLDDSESGPGLVAEPVAAPATAATDSVIPLAEDSSAEAVQEQPKAPARKSKGRKREPAEPRAKSGADGKQPGRQAIR